MAAAVLPGFRLTLGYTLFYTTNFIFTGLAFAVALHAGLFNIGAEGQAYLGGLGVALVCLPLGFLPMVIIIPLAILSAALLEHGHVGARQHARQCRHAAHSASAGSARLGRGVGLGVGQLGLQRHLGPDADPDP